MSIDSFRLGCVGGLILIMGLTYAAWSLRLWLNPDLLSPDSRLYRWIYGSFYSWRRGWSAPPRLNSRQIRRYAIGAVAASALLAAMGMLAIIGAVTG
mgnify:CR=1 FL=1